MTMRLSRNLSQTYRKVRLSAKIKMNCGIFPARLKIQPKNLLISPLLQPAFFPDGVLSLTESILSSASYTLVDGLLVRFSVGRHRVKFAWGRSNVWRRGKPSTWLPRQKLAEVEQGATQRRSFKGFVCRLKRLENYDFHGF